MEEVKKDEVVEEVKKDEEVEELVDYNGFQIPKGALDAVNKRVASETYNLKQKNQKLQEELNNFSTQLEEMKLNSMSEKERIEHEEALRKAEQEKLKAQVSEYSEKYKNYYRDTQLHNEISKHNVINPKQVLNLIKSEYKTDYEETNDEINLFFKNGEDKFTVQEAVKKFLDDPSNSNLLNSSLKSGSGTKSGSNSPKKTLRTEFKRSEVRDHNSEAAQEYRDAMKAGLNPSLIDE